MSSRPAGSDRGRSAVDWEQAFHYYAGLPDPERCYQAVADRYEVSLRTVETHGRRGQWKDRLAAIRAEAAAAADEQLARDRAAKLAELDLLIDASLTSYAHQLRAGSVKVVPADLQRLYKLRDELWTQDAAHTATQRAKRSADSDSGDPEQRKREIITALHEAGAFERLQALAGIHHPQPDRETRAADETQSEDAGQAV